MGKVDGDPQRKVYDLHDSLAISYPGSGRHLQGKLHIVPIPKAGVALSQGIYVEGTAALHHLLSAVKVALGEEP